MQAIILAAGMGRRLKEHTRDVTKCMVKINGVTLIERTLSILDKLGLNRIVIAVGYQSGSLTSFVDSLPLSTPVEYVPNEAYDRTNNIYSLFLARRKLMEDDTLLLESDLIFEESIVRRLLADAYPNLALVARFENWMDGTVAQLGDDNKIKCFLGKDEFVFHDIPSYYKTVNIYKFSRSFSTTHYVPFLEAYSSALGDNQYYEQVLKVIALLERPELKAIRLEGEKWYEIDDVQDLEIAESIFAAPAEQYKKFQSRYGGYWRYPHVLDFHYLVNPFFPPQRLMDEIKANFEKLLTQYPSRLETNNLLMSKFFGLDRKNVVTGNGAAELIKPLMELLPGAMGVIRPTFEEYPNRKNPDSLVVYQAPAPDFAYSADDLMDFFTGSGIQSLVLVNPDNPTGNFISRRELLRLADWAQTEGIRLIVDESFADFADTPDNPSLLDMYILDEYGGMVVIKSISKSFGAAGLRLGLLASGDYELLKSVRRNMPIWNINSFGEFFLQIVEKYKSDYDEAMRRFKSVRRDFIESLESLSRLRVIPTQANYVLCEVSPPFDSLNLAQRLLSEHDILIRDLSDKPGFAGASYCRIAVKNEAENELLLSALRAIFEGADDKA